MSDVDYQKLAKPFPQSAIKQRKGSNGMALNYVQTSSVIRRVIASTGNNYNFRVLDIQMMGDVIVSKVEMEINGNIRQHVGCAKMIANNEDAVKSSISDAYKKVSQLWGCQLDLVSPDYEAAPTQQVPVARPVQATPQGNGNGGNGGNGNGSRQPVATGANVRSGFRPLQSE